jgi:hypothetical protein
MNLPPGLQVQPQQPGYVQQIAQGDMPLRSMQPGLPSAFQDPHTAAVGAAMSAVPALVTSAATVGIPATVGGLAGSALGSAGSGYLAKQLGAGPRGQALAQFGGGMVGGLAGGAGAGKLAGLPESMMKTGGAFFEQAIAKAGKAPVELSPRTDAAIDDLVTASKQGGTLPKVVSDLLERLGPSTKQAAEAEPGPLTYKEARGFQKNITGLSVQEKLSMNKDLQHLVPELANSFSQDVQAAADKAGIGDLHRSGMENYALGGKLQSMRQAAGEKYVNPAIKGAAYGAGGAIGGGAIYELYRLLGGQR